MAFLIAVVMLGLIIFVHELGHFLTAKLFKMPVSEFSIGMGHRFFQLIQRIQHIRLEQFQ